MKGKNPIKIEEILKTLAKDAKPDKKFMSALEKKLQTKWQEVHKPKRSGFFTFLKFKAQFATALCGLILTSTTLYAYHSGSVVEGHILYPLKRGTEKIQSYFADTPEEKYSYYEDLRQRRSEELNFINQNELDFTKAEKTSQEIKKIMKEEIKEIKKLPKEKQKIIIKNLDLSKKEIIKKIDKKKIIPKKDIIIEKKPIFIQNGKNLPKKDNFDFKKSFTINDEAAEEDNEDEQVANPATEPVIEPETQPETEPETPPIIPNNTLPPTTTQPIITQPEDPTLTPATPPAESPDSTNPTPTLETGDPIIEPIDPGILIPPPEDLDEKDAEPILIPLNPIDLDWDYSKIFRDPENYNYDFNTSGLNSATYEFSK